MARCVYELYTSSLTRAHAHYQMSVTKSVVSALVGIVIDRGLIKGPDAPITDTLPRSLFASEADVARFKSMTVHHVLGMSALDAPDPPRVTTPDALARARQTAPRNARDRTHRAFTGGRRDRAPDDHPVTQPYQRWLGAAPSSRYAIFMRLR
jgi:CubicO group peptidase (beta-lactamase class C family)